MEEKAIVLESELCTGCMRCMTTCSTYNFGATSLTKDRIHIVRHEGHAITKIEEEDELIFEALSCQQCDQPFCMAFCSRAGLEAGSTNSYNTLLSDALAYSISISLKSLLIFANSGGRSSVK